MTGKEYLEECRKTAASDDFKESLLHAAIGIATESGELLDAIKKNRFNNQLLDIENMREELGDLCWYISLAIDTLNKHKPDSIDPRDRTTWESIWEANIRKLRVRYGEKYSDHRAKNRNLKKEYEALKGEE